jgi:two-component system, OmpR family, phosphate regulon response regulator PhoB
MAQRILVIEDEPDLIRALEYNLKEGGFDVTCTTRGRDGLRLVQQWKPDLVLLDLMLPDTTGMEVCKQIKNNPESADIRVIMVTAKGEEVDRVVGFEMGADDYVVKPFSVRELMLRIRAVLRRAEEKATEEDNIEFGCLNVDMGAHRVYVEGVEQQLTAIEFRLLTTLHARKNRVQSRETLLKDVWGIHLNVESRTVDTHIKRLREKLGKAGVYIETVRGVGYRFADTPQSHTENVSSSLTQGAFVLERAMRFTLLRLVANSHWWMEIQCL